MKTKDTKIIISNLGRDWTFNDCNDFQVWNSGDNEFLEKLLEKKNNDFTLSEIKSILKNVNKNFSCIIKTEQLIYAIVDHCRSIPLFYSVNDSNRKVIISNAAKAIKEEANLNEVNRTSALELAMAGYVTGCETLYKNLFQIKAGELLIVNKSGINKHTYYDYLPDTIFDANKNELSTKFETILDSVIDDTIKKANGRKVWIPLSAGLDSRLLLCKFVQRKYNEIVTFSYGPNNNDEALAARKIANILGVAWSFICSSRNYMKYFFSSKERLLYWEFSDNLCSIPTFQDYLTLSKLNLEKKLPQNILMVNGQTGDFISGGHIPEKLTQDNATIDDLIDCIITKHYSLWSSLKTNKNIKIIKQKILKILSMDQTNNYDSNELIAAYEKWEYHERQSKYVVNGQRNYEFLNLDWALPFWDKRIVEFWRRVPIKYKYNQNLYKYFLDRYNFKQLFSNKNYVVWEWPGLMKVVLPICRIIRLTFGYKARDNFIKAMLYFGMYRDLYAHISYKEYLKYYRDIRNPMSFFAKQWLLEKDINLNSI